MKKLMSNGEMDKLIQNNLKLTHYYWKGETRFCKTHDCIPRQDGLSKRDFIFKWFVLLDDSWCSRQSASYQKSEDFFNQFTFAQLTFTFHWVFDHWLEFSLGGNMAWHGALETIAVHMRGRGKKPISENFERKLKTAYILRTRTVAELNEVMTL